MNKKIIKGITMLVMILTICSIAFNVFALTPGEVTGDSATAKVTGIDTLGNNIVKILHLTLYFYILHNNQTNSIKSINSTIRLISVKYNSVSLLTTVTIPKT